MEAIKLIDVWVRLDRKVVLEEVNFWVEEGDFVGIIGPNGAGKTTLLKVILGLIEPVKGSVFVYGLPPHKGRQFLGYVPQHGTFNKDFPLKVFDVVLMGRLRGKGPFRGFSRHDREQVEEVLTLLEVYHLKDRLISTLSGGELQRVLIARALASEAKMLLLDEPTSNVDIPFETEFFELLQNLRAQKGLTILLVTHDVGVLSQHVEKIACLNRRMYYHGTKEIRPEELEAVYGCPVDLIAHGVPHRVLKDHT